MKKVIGFFPHITFIPGAPNVKWSAQEEERSKLIRSHEEKYPNDSVWTVGRSSGDTVYAQLGSEFKKQTQRERDDYCKRKGIFDDEIPEGCHVSLGSGGYSIVRNIEINRLENNRK